MISSRATNEWFRKTLETLKDDINPRTYLKFVSLVIAVFIWVLASGERTSTLGIEVPLTIIPPPDMMITSVTPETQKVAIRIIGARTLLNNFVDGGPLPYTLDLRNDPPYTSLTVKRLVPELYSLPGGVLAETITPKQLTISLTRRQRKRVRLELQLVGHPASNYGIDSVDLEPETVVLSGPEDVLASLNKLVLPPIDLNDAKQDISLDVTPALPEKVKRMGGGRIMVQVHLWKQRQIKSLPIQVINTDLDVDTVPNTASVVIQGEPTIIDRVEQENLRLYFDARALRPGTHLAEIQADLAAELRVVRIEPSAVRLRLMVP